ncbi:hypothetical protein EV182_005121, partial [Spiromyces aspiralis]
MYIKTSVLFAAAAAVAVSAQSGLFDDDDDFGFNTVTSAKGGSGGSFGGFDSNSYLSSMWETQREALSKDLKSIKNRDSSYYKSLTKALGGDDVPETYDSEWLSKFNEANLDYLRNKGINLDGLMGTPTSGSGSGSTRKSSTHKDSGDDDDETTDSPARKGSGNKGGNDEEDEIFRKGNGDKGDDDDDTSLASTAKVATFAASAM